MAAGVPVVATRTGSLPEILGDAAQWAEPGDVDTLVTAIEATLDDPNVIDSLIHAGFERLTHFSWDRSTDELVTLFELACATRA